MSNQKLSRATKTATPPDNLTKVGEGSSIELTETDLDQVSGGKAKTANKAYDGMDDYIRG